MTETTTKPRARKAATVSPDERCACQSLRLHLTKEQADAVPAKYRPYVDPKTLILETGCGQFTRRTFAPGHDARVKGLLQFAHRNSVKVTDATGREATPESLFPTLSHLITAPAPVAPIRTPRIAKAKAVWAKVGRWTYKGTVNDAGQFVYTDKNDESVTVDRFTVVAGKDNAKGKA